MATRILIADDHPLTRDALASLLTQNFRGQLARFTEFLDLRLRARERLRGLRFRPAFATPRPGARSWC